MDRAEPTVSQHLAEVLQGFEYEDLSLDVIAAAKVLIVDTLMVALAGASSPDVEGVARLATSQGGRPEARLWGSGQRVPASEAAFINTMAASALDYDSLHDNVHPDAIALSAALAMAQRQHASGKDFLTAFVLGTELICRLSDASTGSQKGWTLGSVLGTFGAAAAGARLLRLDTTRTAHALGIALSTAAGSQQSNVEKVLTKRVQPALAARSGVHAALLADAGITAPSQAFEGRFGLWSLYFAGDRSRLLDGFGERFSMLRTGLKQYPVCACSHAAMVGLSDLMFEHRLHVDDIVHIEAVISPFMDRLVGGDFRPADNPQVTAQFCLKYALAVTASRGGLGLHDLDDAAVLDTAIVPLTERVSSTIDPANTGELAPATVKVTLKNGTLVERTVATMPGSAALPMSMAQRRVKYAACAAKAEPPLSGSAIDRLDHWVAAVEAIDDMATATW